MFEIKEAKREAAPIFAALIGGSGSGKTYSALLLARGIVGPAGKIGVIDTEGKRALMYAEEPEIGGFLHMDFVPPYSSDRFREAVNQYVKHGVDCIVVDSASHEHEAEGGMLDYADQEEARMSNNPRRAQAKWIKPKMAHNRFIRTAVSCPAHMIFCIREKTIIDTATNPPKKIQVAVCESNLPFEFMLSINVHDEGIAQFNKVPKPFTQHVRNGERITVEHGALLMKEASRGDNTQHLAAIIHNLTEAAESGTDVFKMAWQAAWRNNGPAGDTKTMTPERVELQKNLDGFKAKAAAADAAEEARRQHEEDGERDTSDDGLFGGPA